MTLELCKSFRGKYLGKKNDVYAKYIFEGGSSM